MKHRWVIRLYCGFALVIVLAAVAGLFIYGDNVDVRKAIISTAKASLAFYLVGAEKRLKAIIMLAKDSGIR